MTRNCSRSAIQTSDYKKAMLIFYEQNNLYAFKQIFIDQFEFAVREYFRNNTGDINYCSKLQVGSDRPVKVMRLEKR